MALFSSSRPSSASSRHFVEFKAGKMTLKDRMLTADKRKGKVYIWRSPTDQLVHFCWKDRATGRLEDDLIVFPDDTEFKKISQCKTGRVYVLKFRTSNRRLFFWLQEPKIEKDDAYCQKVNEALNNPEAAVPGGSGSQFDQLPPGLASHLGEEQLGIVRGMDRQQLMQLFGMAARPDSAAQSDLGEQSRGTSESGQGNEQEHEEEPVPMADSTMEQEEVKPQSEDSGGRGVPAAAEAASAPLQLPDMGRLLANMQKTRNEVQPEIAHVLSSEAIVPLLHDQVTYERLRPLMPEGLADSQQAAAEDLSSPQFQQAARVFSSAFETGQLGALVTQFDMPEAAVQSASMGDTAGFLTHLQDNLLLHEGDEPMEAQEELPDEEDVD